ncbi:MAG: WecB/TagA/CpsF family glycosyltransferase [Pseudomonadota bacterium]
MKAKRIEILGVPVDVVNMSRALDTVDAMLRERSRRNAVIAVNPEKVMRAMVDGQLLAQIRSASLLIPDGIGVVFAARLLGLGRMERVPGSELMPALCGLAARKGYGIFMLGASPEVNQCAARKIQETYPGIRLAGRRDGFFRPEEIDGVIDQINASGADILFLALGSPRQEIWMQSHLPRLNVGVCQGVGGTFDVICGKVRRAPVIMRRLHLEWLYRLMLQPGRFLRQTSLPRFVYLVMREKLKGSGKNHDRGVD